MRSGKALLSLLLLLVYASAHQPAPAALGTFGAPEVEIIEVKSLGISAADETKSVIEVKWLTRSAPITSFKSFELTLESTYADGAMLSAHQSVAGTARATRVEVPTLHLAPGRAPAVMKLVTASVTATFTETTTKQVPL